MAKVMLDAVKTNVRLSKNMKEKFVELSKGEDLVFVSRIMLLEFVKEYNQKGIEHIVLEMLKYKTFRKVAMDDSDKENTEKSYMLTVKMEKYEFLTVKKLCDEIGISFAECVRRLINRAIENDNSIN